MAKVTLEQLRERLSLEDHLTWVFYRGKDRTDKEDKDNGIFRREGANAWTGHWVQTPKVKYDRIAHWNDQDQILYIGKKPSHINKKLVGKKWLLPMSEVETFDVFPKSTKPVKLQTIIPEAIGRIQNLTYWPQGKEEYLEREKDNKKRLNRKLDQDETANLITQIEDSKVDEETKNNLKREIWCRSGEYAKYRAKLLKLWDNKCAISGLAMPELLIASHIKPWSQCEDPKEQTDPANGFMLASPIDKLFDRGYLTICDDGTLELHKRGHARHLTKAALTVFGLNASSLPRVKPKLSAKNLTYLAYHREYVFNR